jgi:hypothetical protein
MGSFLAFSTGQLLLLIISLAIFVIPGWRIARKAGYPGAVSLLLLIPMLNIVFLWIFAFSRWPNQREGG